jgi:RecQ-mediated genome instability protein 1
MQARLDRADLGLAQEENEHAERDEDEGPVPRFSRGMLRFELSDGLTTIRASPSLS